MACAWPGTLIAQPFPPSPPDRRESVAGWRVEHVYDGDDGRDVGMTIRRGGYRITYYANYWRGNARPYRRASVVRGGETCRSLEWQDDGDDYGFPPDAPEAVLGRAIRDRVASWLVECGAGEGQAERLLRGFSPAFARLAEFADVARRYSRAVNCSIVHYGEPQDEVRRRCHRP